MYFIYLFVHIYGVPEKFCYMYIMHGDQGIETEDIIFFWVTNLRIWYTNNKCYRNPSSLEQKEFIPIHIIEMPLQYVCGSTLWYHFGNLADKAAPFQILLICLGQRKSLDHIYFKKKGIYFSPLETSTSHQLCCVATMYNTVHILTNTW